MDTKQIIIMRKDLNMRKGKMISQACHSTLKLYIDLCKRGVIFDDNEGPLEYFTFYYKKDSAWDNWLNGRFTKILVSCNSEQELDDLYLKAKEANLPCTMLMLD